MRRHALDPFSLVAGLGFTGVGLVFLLGDANLATRLRWVWPILLVSAGAGVLLKLALPGERREAAPAAGPADATTAEPPRATDPYLDAAAAPDLAAEPEPPPHAGAGPVDQTEVSSQDEPPDEPEPGPAPRDGVGSR